ncbi:helix-turn-helix domain-containing protein [Natrarchaeobius chitinivorans]|uniref:Bacterio-opsin activator n=1 Tax=Natrarchaeobius chitinivorans TaxID=1679083 RepID=A0A3N6M091_NATCH|nr:helix-turn-helix domain-containing protein [Natrarchaeobius chitinivorans]RQG96633.1 bacterio-opsin activator [Natrarchaeobius chitinivorans]
MSVIAEISVPVDAFVLGRILDDVPAVEIELERIVPLEEGITPLFWISGASAGEIEAILRDQPEIENFDVVTRIGNRALFEVTWDPEITGLIQALMETRAKILEATGTARRWDFKIRFHSHDNLSSFNVRLTNLGITVTLRKIYVPSPDDTTDVLSSDQRELLLLAHREGYFKVPRRTTLSELATKEGVSDSAISQRLRRALDSFISYELISKRQ